MKERRTLGIASDELNVVEIAYYPEENRLVILNFEQDLEGNTLRNIRGYKGFIKQEELTPEILKKLFIAISEKRYPLLCMRDNWNTITPLERTALEEACNKSTCICPLFHTIGCYILLTTEIENLIKTKIVQFFFTKLIPIYGHDLIQSIWETGIGRTIATMGGGGIPYG